MTSLPLKLGYCMWCLCCLYDVYVYYLIGLAYLFDKLEPRCYCDRILTVSALAVEISILLRLKLSLTIDKALQLRLANWL